MSLLGCCGLRKHVTEAKGPLELRREKVKRNMSGGRSGEGKASAALSTGRRLHYRVTYL